MSHLHGRRRLAGSLAAVVVSLAVAGCGTSEATVAPTPAPARLRRTDAGRRGLAERRAAGHRRADRAGPRLDAGRRARARRFRPDRRRRRDPGHGRCGRRRRSGRRAGHRPDIERWRRDLGERAAPRDCAHDRAIDRLGRPRPDARRRRWRLRTPVGHRDLDPGRRRSLAGRAVRSDPVRRRDRPGRDVRRARRDPGDRRRRRRFRLVVGRRPHLDGPIRGRSRGGCRRAWPPTGQASSPSVSGPGRRGRHGAPTARPGTSRSPSPGSRKERSSATPSCSVARSWSSWATRAAPSGCCDPTGAAAGDRS